MQHVKVSFPTQAVRPNDYIQPIKTLFKNVAKITIIFIRSRKLPTINVVQLFYGWTTLP